MLKTNTKPCLCSNATFVITGPLNVTEPGLMDTVALNYVSDAEDGTQVVTSAVSRMMLDVWFALKLVMLDSSTTLRQSRIITS